MIHSFLTNSHSSKTIRNLQDRGKTLSKLIMLQEILEKFKSRLHLKMISTALSVTPQLEVSPNSKDEGKILLDLPFWKYKRSIQLIKWLMACQRNYNQRYRLRRNTKTSLMLPRIAAPATRVLWKWVTQKGSKAGPLLFLLTRHWKLIWTIKKIGSIPMVSVRTTWTNKEFFYRERMKASWML